MLKGIDVSGNQGIDVYEKYRPDFVMFKATEGVGYVTDALNQHYAAAAKWFQENKKPFLYGFYHYARPDTGNSAEAEAKSFLNYTGHHAGHALYALDWEGEALDTSKTWPLRFLRVIAEKTGSTPYIYMSASVSRQEGWKDVATIAKLWVAAYNNDAAPQIGTEWPTWSMWQFTDKPLDQDKFPANIAAWYNLCDARRQHASMNWFIEDQTAGKIVLKEC